MNRDRLLNENVKAFIETIHSTLYCIILLDKYTLENKH